MRNCSPKIGNILIIPLILISSSVRLQELNQPNIELLVNWWKLEKVLNAKVDNENTIGYMQFYEDSTLRVVRFTSQKGGTNAYSLTSMGMWRKDNKEMSKIHVNGLTEQFSFHIIKLTNDSLQLKFSKDPNIYLYTEQQ